MQTFSVAFRIFCNNRKSVIFVFVQHSTLRCWCFLGVYITDNKSSHASFAIRSAAANISSLTISYIIIAPHLYHRRNVNVIRQYSVCVCMCVTYAIHMWATGDGFIKRQNSMANAAGRSFFFRYSWWKQRP